MTWLAVAVGGSALVGAGASYFGSKTQAKGAEKAAGINLDMFNTLNRQQQPFIQSGYGAMGKLNTLLGIGGGGAANQSYYGGQGGNVRPMPIKQNPTTMQVPGGMGQGMQGNIAQSTGLKRLLALRAQNGDNESARMLSMMG